MENKSSATPFNGHVRDAREARSERKAQLKDRARVEEAKKMMRPIVERGGRYLETFEAQMRAQPWLAVTLGAGGVMVAGAILGSRLGRTALLVGCGYALHEVLNRQDIGRFAHEIDADPSPLGDVRT